MPRAGRHIVPSGGGCQCRAARVAIGFRSRRPPRVRARAQAGDDDDDDGWEGTVSWDTSSASVDAAPSSKKGKSWYKYTKSTRELKRLQKLMPDLEENGLFAEEDDPRGGALVADGLAPFEDAPNFAAEVEASGLAYVARGGKVKDPRAFERALGWRGPSGEDALPKAPHRWGRTLSQVRDEESGAADADEAPSLPPAFGPKARDWAEFEAPAPPPSPEQRILEHGMMASELHLMHDREEQSWLRAGSGWYLKEQFVCEYLCTNLVIEYANRRRGTFADGVEMVHFEETGAYFCRYRPQLMSQVLFEMESALRSGGMDAVAINTSHMEAVTRDEHLIKTMNYLRMRDLKVQFVDAMKARYDLVTMTRDPWDRFKLNQAERLEGIERVSDMLACKDGAEEAEAARAAQERTILDDLLDADAADHTQRPLEGPSTHDMHATFVPVCDEDYLPEWPEDAVLRVDLGGHAPAWPNDVEFELRQDILGTGRPQTIKRLLGYSLTEHEQVRNHWYEMWKTEDALNNVEERGGKERGTLPGRGRGEGPGGRGGNRSPPRRGSNDGYDSRRGGGYGGGRRGRDADAALGLPFDAPEDGSGSSMFQEAVDMFQDDPKE